MSRRIALLVCLGLLSLGLTACQSARPLTNDVVAATYAAPVVPAGSASDVVLTADGDDAAEPAPPPSEAYAGDGAPIVANSCCWSGCGLPCEQGITTWNVRAVVGYHVQSGDDTGEPCEYYGIDFGRDLCCPCWGIDGFLRYHEGRYDRIVPGAIGALATTEGEDGGETFHIGVKVTYERSLRNSRWFWWAGAGPEYYWTNDYLDDDSGFGVYGEVGLGYMLSQSWRIRAGINAHWLPDATYGRENPADDGDGRSLLIIAPTISIELDF